MNRKDSNASKSGKSRNCPTCGSSSDLANLFLKENYDPRKINKYSFASRKNPEFMCHKLVECNICDLVYTDTPPTVEELSDLYHEAEFDSNEEANDAAESYIKSLARVIAKLDKKNIALDIGTGTGILLDKFKEVGFNKVIGVEPSVLPIKAAPDYRKEWIVNDIFKPSYFDEKSLNLIFCAMTMEHVQDPKVIAQDSFNLLDNGGAVAFVVHDRRSFVNRILGKKSPIIDIEHLQLFSKKSIYELLKRTGYSAINVKSFRNTYPIKYWIRLTPLPNSLKNLLINFLNMIRLGNIKLSFNVGNLLAYGIRVVK